jgi:hypothetical protein
MKKILLELAEMRATTKNGYFLITYDPKADQWDVSMPQAKYRSHWKSQKLKIAIQQCLDWVYRNRKPISPRHEYEL